MIEEVIYNKNVFVFLYILHIWAATFLSFYSGEYGYVYQACDYTLVI